MIKTVRIPEIESKKRGLTEIRMDSLSKYIVFSGKNGAGKTRVIKIIDYFYKMFYENFSKKEDIQLDIRSKMRFIETMKSQMASSDADSDTVAIYEKQIKSYEDAIFEKSEILDILTNYFVTDIESDSVFIDPKLKELLSYRSVTQGYIPGIISDIENFSLSAYNEISLPYIYYLSDKFIKDTHHEFGKSDDEKYKIALQWSYFKEIFKKFLGSDIILSGNDIYSFGFYLDKIEFSDGQNICLQIAVALQIKKGSLDGLIIFMDEPELHLHPSVVIDFIEEMDKLAPSSQFFIATHSVPLISYLHAKDQNSLWFVEDGSVKRAGRTPEHVLKSLLGDQDRINELRSFTELPEILAQINYAVQCLERPGVSGPMTADTQNTQIYRVLSNLKNGGQIRLLDYGAGRGRILDGLAENASGKPEEKFDYFAFDAYPDHASECKSVIGQYYDNPDARYADNLNNYIQATESLLGSFDVVLLCNVLHEISPNEWVNLFKNESPIDRLLSDNGYLLIVEDNRIPVGEKAHDFGFIVLDRAELQSLFGIPADAGNDFVSDDARAGRGLKAHLIHKKLLKNINISTVGAAVRSVKSTAETEIKIIRDSGETDYKKGLKNAFWVHQYTNSSLYLSSRGEG